MRFFKPTPAFFKWIELLIAKQSSRRVVVDCGCGGGELVLELTQRKIPTIGLDPYANPLDLPMEIMGKVLAMHAQESTFVTNMPSILLVCRPCHNGFPGHINSVRHKDSSFYYIGQEYNMEFDLRGAKTKLVFEGAGKEGESVWEVKYGTGDKDYEYLHDILMGKRRRPNMSLFNP